MSDAILEHMAPQKKRCGRCKRWKALSAFHSNKSRTDGLRADCKSCRRQTYEYVKQHTKPHPCEGGCGKEITRTARCNACREQRRLELEQDALAPARALSPTQCPIPVRGGICRTERTAQIRRDGVLVFWCSVHGEAEVPVTRPVDFRRYDQRERLEAELLGSVESAQRAVDTDASARSQGRTKVTIAKSGNFVVGRAAREAAA